MREQEFIASLSHALRVLPQSQREDILADYRSHFFEARERGKLDEEIVRGLGDIHAIAQTYVADYHLGQFHSPDEGQGVGTRFLHLARAGVVLASLLFFNFFFMIFPFFFVLGFLFAAWACVGVVIAMSLTVGSMSLAGFVPEIQLLTMSAKFAMFFYMCGGVLLGLILLRGLFTISRLFALGVLHYIRLNLKLIAP